MPLLTVAHNLSHLTALQSALQVVQKSPGFHVALWADADCPTASYSTKKLLCLARFSVGHFIPLSTVPTTARLGIIGFVLAPFSISHVV